MRSEISGPAPRGSSARLPPGSPPRPDSAGHPGWTGALFRPRVPTPALPPAALICGIGRPQAYELAKNDAFPVPVIGVGARYRVAVAGILAAFQLPADPRHTDPTT